MLTESRSNAKKAVIVVTDGKSNIGPPPVRQAVELRRLRWSKGQSSRQTSSPSAEAKKVKDEWDEENNGPQVEIYAFGVADANRDELRSIASDLPGHLFQMSTFSLFQQFATSIHGGQLEKWRELLIRIAMRSYVRLDFGGQPILSKRTAGLSSWPNYGG